MIALDACTLIYAAKYHKKNGVDLIPQKAAAKLLSQRGVRTFEVPEVVAGEVIATGKGRPEIDLLCGYLRRFAIIPSTEERLRTAVRLVRSYPERRLRGFRKDAAAYVIAADAGATAFCTFDRGFISPVNRAKLQEHCQRLGIPFAPVHDALELLAMPQINPKRTPKAKDPVHEARKRADALARKYAGIDYLDQMRFFVGVARSFGFGAKGKG